MEISRTHIIETGSIVPGLPVGTHDIRINPTGFCVVSAERPEKQTTRKRTIAFCVPGRWNRLRKVILYPGEVLRVDTRNEAEEAFSVLVECAAFLGPDTYKEGESVVAPFTPMSEAERHVARVNKIAEQAHLRRLRDIEDAGNRITGMLASAKAKSLERQANEPGEDEQSEHEPAEGGNVPKAGEGEEADVAAS